MKYFIEEEVDLKSDSAMGIVQSVVSMVILAPLWMFNQISIKVIYLRKAQILKMLLNSIIIGVIVIVANIAFGYAVNNAIEIWVGTMPIAAMLLGIAVLVVLYFVFSFIDLRAYADLDILRNSPVKPVQSAVLEDSVQMEDSDIPDDVFDAMEKAVLEQTEIPTTQKQYKIQRGEVPSAATLLSAIHGETSLQQVVTEQKQDVVRGQQDVVRGQQDVAGGQQDVVRGQQAVTEQPEKKVFKEELFRDITSSYHLPWHVSIGKSLGKVLDVDRKASLKQQLDEVEEQSKYISRSALEMLNYKDEILDSNNLDSLNINLIPAKYRAFS